MTSYNLRSDESILMQDHVWYKSAKESLFSANTYELIVTNQNIIVVVNGAFGQVKETRKFPFTHLKKVNGQPAVMINNNGNIVVSFVNSDMVFSMNSKREMKKWVSNFIKIVCGEPIDVGTELNVGIPGADVVAETLKDTFDTFKDTFGLNKNAGNDRQAVAGKCRSCGAPISGVKGQVVKCEYCDTEQQL